VHLYVQWYRAVIQCYVMMSACSVVRLCAVVNKLHFYFYIRCNKRFVMMLHVFRFSGFFPQSMCRIRHLLSYFKRFVHCLLVFQQMHVQVKVK
jgi:hypothetical protein